MTKQMTNEEYVEWITKEVKKRQRKKDIEKEANNYDIQEELSQKFKDVIEDYKETKEWN